MKVDSIYLLFENNNKFFPSYELAYFNSKKSCDKTVYYVFTPTMQRFKRVCEIEKCCRDYFKNVCDSDYFDIIHRTSFKQLTLV